MPLNPPVSAASSEVAREFSHFSEVALTSPVIVTENGHERSVILSIDEYNRLIRRDRTVYRAEDTPEAFMSEIDALIASLPEA